jgi:hypothetical protein
MNTARKYRNVCLAALLAGLAIPCYAADKYVSGDAKIVTDPTLGYTYAERLRHVELFNGVIPDGDLEVYLAFLSRHPEDDNVNEDQLGTIKNDIVDKLIKARRAPDELGRILLANIDDAKQGATWRNYALQKLGEIYLISNNDKLKVALVGKLEEKTHDPENYNSSTALLGLYRLSEKDRFFKERTDKLAVQVMDDGRYTPSDRAIALEVAARLGDEHALTQARELLAERSTPICLKVASIAAIGIAGTPSDIAALNPYSKSGDVRIRNAARHSIALLNGTEPSR